MHRAVLLSRGTTIGPEAIILPDDTDASSDSDDDFGQESPSLVGRSVADVERRLIVDTLAHTLGNRTRAATILGISIRTLRNKLKQYGEEGMVIPPSGKGAFDATADRL